MGKAVVPPPGGQLKLTTHFLLCTCSLWPQFPQCISCREIGSCLCCNVGQECGLITDFKVCCRMSHQGFCCDRDKLMPLTSCTLCAASMDCVQYCCCEGAAENSCTFPKTCCKCAEQCLCIDCRAALPPDSDVPLGCSICGAHIWGGKPGGGWSAVAPSAQSMS